MIVTGMTFSIVARTQSLSKVSLSEICKDESLKSVVGLFFRYAHNILLAGLGGHGGYVGDHV